MNKNKERKVYYIDFDENEFESGINFIAITQNPAIEVNAMRFSAEELIDFKFTVDSEKRTLVGPAIIPDKEIKRIDELTGEEYYVVFTKEVIEKMVNKFSKEFREVQFNLEHTDYKINAFVKASWIIEDSKKDKSSYYGFELPVGTFFVEAKVESDKDWELVKKMDTVGFSIEGLMRLIRKQIEKQKNEIFNNKKTKAMKKRKLTAKYFKKGKEVKSYNSSLKKFEIVAAQSEDEILIVDELKEGEDIMIVTDEMEVVAAPDGLYEIESEDIAIEVKDGEIEDIMSIEEAQEEVQEEELSEDKEDKEEMMEEGEEDSQFNEMEEMLSKIAELQARIDELESRMPAEKEEEVIFDFSISDKLAQIKKLKNNQ